MHMKAFFPSGRCYAAQVHDPASSEWPPHPSRLFSALVASAYKSENGMTEHKRAALEWLEALPAPTISSPIVDQKPAPVSYVPTGDLVGRKGKKGQEVYEHPVHRWLQARHFPSAVILGEPMVYYNWQEEPDESYFKALDEIASGVSHLGTSHSMVVITAGPEGMPRSPSLIPDQQGDRFLRVTARGRLKELDAVFKQTAGVRRPTPLCESLAPYRNVDDSSSPTVASGTEFITLRISETMHGADTAAYLGRAVRKAVMSALGNECPAAVHGHNGGVHIGWLPLPDVGHDHAKGRVIGIGILIPESLDENKRLTVFKAVGRIQELRLPDGRVANLSMPSPGERVPVTLAKRTWTKPCTTWATVTPVVLDRPPKRLTENRLRGSLSQSLSFAGYPKPSDIKISSFSVFKGAPPAFRIPAEKPRYHAVVHFEQPVAGPVIAGRLRYFGVGLFRPMPAFEA